ncbi:MAG: (Fe-S)-binding protein [Candidatus Altiarchaeales archaeon]|nr:(Fe-S)-binding protein [Candidatus Altiarchaeales archaeon]
MLGWLFDKLKGGNTLYYPGCMTKFALKDKQEKYEKLLKKLGIEYIKLPDVELCCGIPVLNAGYVEDFEELKKKNLEIFKEYDVKKIITNCPGCCHTLKNEYGLDAEHITQVLARNIDKVENWKQETVEARENLGKPWKLENRGNRENLKTVDITYHDPCHLGRWGGIFGEPREVLKKKGFTVKELDYSRSESLCCGGGGGLRQNDKNAASKVACNVLNQVKTKKLVTACPMCFYHLRENAKDVEVLDYIDAVEE